MGPLRLSAVLALLALTGCLAGVAAAAGWHVIGSSASSGDFAVTAANGSAHHPHHLAVRLSGRGVSGFAAVACSKGFSIGSKTTNYKGAGIHLLKLPMSNASSCDVTASVSGSGRITLRILAN
jgi:hypothetical protein